MQVFQTTQGGPGGAGVLVEEDFMADKKMRPIFVPASQGAKVRPMTTNVH